MRLLTTDDIIQADAARELCHAEIDELQPAGHLAQFPVLMVLLGQGLKFLTRD
jgi:hypothetical protein